MYAWTSTPWKTSAVLRAARTLFTDTPYGMPGNDDLGTISSWLVFAMAGVFEAQPGSGTYLLSAPMFEKVEINPDHGRKVSIEAPGASAAKLQYVSSVRVRNHDLGASWISHQDLLRAGKIRIDLSAAPTAWGTQAVPPKLLDAG
jgi:putative alpha-1,2-mannosidase